MKRLYLYIIIVTGVFLCANFSIDKKESLEIPATNSSEEIICHTGYCLSYDYSFKLAKWIAYELTIEETQGTQSRKDNFKPDPSITNGSAALSDYKKSGYDRGHLAPAADMKWSAQAMSESFYLSNMCPQDKSFNRGIWKKLEEQVREWAIQNKSIYIVTGPVLEKGLPTIGINHIPIPKYCYKVLLDYTQPNIKAIGFIVPNQGSQLPLSEFACSIDKIEEITHIDFFPKLPDSIEQKLEQEQCLSCWGL
jgi:endonuclease G